jgi:hypothetical protein
MPARVEAKEGAMSAISNLSAGVVRAGEGEQHTVAGLTFIFKSLEVRPKRAGVR